MAKPAPEGLVMRISTLAVFVAGALLVAGSIFPGSARSQNAPVPPAVQDASAKPIGKVVTATGAVTIEHVNAVVVQATLGNQGGVKVGDLVYLGDVVQTGADGRVGITFTDGTAFNLSSNARMAMTEFVYDPNSKSNSSLLSLTKGTFTFVAGKIAKTGDRKKVMDTNKSTDCPKCSKPTRIVKRVKDRERGIPGGVYISCSACDFYEKL